MYLRELTVSQQEVFLDLAYTLMVADQKIDEREKEIFSWYKLEVDADVAKAKEVDFEKEINKFTDLSPALKKKIYVELVGMAYADNKFAGEEKALLKVARNKLDIDEATAEKLQKALVSLFESFAGLNKLVEA